MQGFGRPAADEGVEAVDTVDEAFPAQELERAVDCGRGHPAALVGQPLHDLVGADRGVALPDCLQHAAAQLGQAQAALRADRLGLDEGVAHAARMVVRGDGERVGGPGGMVVLIMVASIAAIGGTCEVAHRSG